MENMILEQALKNLEIMLEHRNYIPVYDGFPKVDILHRMVDRKYFTPSGKFALTTVVGSTSQIKQYSDYIENDEFETIIFLYQNNITATHSSIEKNLNYKIEIWGIESLLINIMEHELQPLIQKIDGLKIKGKLPKISFKDPVCRYNRFKPKDILKITNKKTGFIHYRIVV